MLFGIKSIKRGWFSIYSHIWAFPSEEIDSNIQEYTILSNTLPVCIKGAMKAMCFLMWIERFASTWVSLKTPLTSGGSVAYHLLATIDLTSFCLYKRVLPESRPLKYTHPLGGSIGLKLCFLVEKVAMQLNLWGRDCGSSPEVSDFLFQPGYLFGLVFVYIAIFHGAFFLLVFSCHLHCVKYYLVLTKTVKSHLIRSDEGCPQTERLNIPGQWHHCTGVLTSKATAWKESPSISKAYYIKRSKPFHA